MSSGSGGLQTGQTRIRLGSAEGAGRGDAGRVRPGQAYIPYIISLPYISLRRHWGFGRADAQRRKQAGQTWSSERRPEALPPPPPPPPPAQRRDHVNDSDKSVMVGAAVDNGHLERPGDRADRTFSGKQTGEPEPWIV